MKKIAGKIAVILILVILASCFTSCLSYWGRSHTTGKRVLYAVVDIVFLPISLIALLIYVIVTQETGEAQSYLANMDDYYLSEYYFLYEKMYSLPEEELASLMQILNSIPETERGSTMERIASISETKLASLVMAYNSLPESDIISSLGRIKSLPETEIVSLLHTFNSFTEAELDSVIESINPQSETGNVAVADDLYYFPVIEALEAKPVTLVFE